MILLGEMRDYETINTAMTAAETGHLIFSTLHTIGAANTIDRIIDAFPAAQQHQVAVQLSMVLHAVVSQRLLPTTDGKMVPAFEIMVLTPAIRNIIREGKTHQIDGMIYTSTNENMLAMDTSISAFIKKASSIKNCSCKCFQPGNDEQENRSHLGSYFFRIISAFPYLADSFNSSSIRSN